MKPLADRIRPDNIEEIVGQEHILGKDKILNKLIKNRKVVNMIFYGPPGVGKTTVANLIARFTDKKLYKLNATTASVKDIQEIIKDLNSLMTFKGIVLYLDEIQNFNKKQQQSLLEFMEDGRITLIASTTENPYHYIYNAILSRATIFEFKPLKEENIVKALMRGLRLLNDEFKNTEIKAEEDVLKYIAIMCNGDLRRAINALELLVYSTNPNEENKLEISMNDVKESMQGKAFNFDKYGDNYYDALSALQKSIRGSDPDAAIFYASMLIKGGQLLSICRRLLVIASEDIGLAYPQAASITYSLVQSAMQLGLPEARIPIAQAVILLATSPKSNSSYKAIKKALLDIENKNIGEIPIHLRDNHYYGAKQLKRTGYKYPHDHKGNYVEQQYLPDELIGRNYYIPGDNKMERAIKGYLNSLKNEY
ncbi:replication-associated recombination protein A [Clostridium ganghwense]|uniref:Replication-associated recombination protein A n=1 Tax=Clostridium ganghwense TaxID=312089 RepID=A0ABT4CTD2_9CLOT|nr:replication-associated recombination protein A [Clostridium ganghwense]MCY6372309.1 replication-associated recombination protein A [Clostridium ganghwense]